MTQKYIVFIFLYSFYISLIYFLGPLLKIIVYQIKKAIFKQNICFIMNLKERGITVGDLLIILIIIITTAFVFKTTNNNKKTSFEQMNQDITSFKRTSPPKNL